jgi:hypothetical protein
VASKDAEMAIFTKDLASNDAKTLLQMMQKLNFKRCRNLY